MPNIPQFTNPDTQIRPSDLGSSAFELEGRHIGADIDIAGRYISGALSQVGDRISAEQYGLGSAAISKSYSELDANEPDLVNQFLSSHDLSDPETRNQYLALVQERADKLDPNWDNMSPELQRFAQENKTRFVNNSVKSFSAELARTAADQAGAMFEEGIDNRRKLVSSDPSQLDAQLDFTDLAFSHTFGENPNISAADKAKSYAHYQKARNDLIETGMIEQSYRNPEQFAKDFPALTSKYNLSAEQQEALTRINTVNIDRARASDQQKRLDAERALKDRSDKAEAELTGAFISGGQEAWRQDQWQKIGGLVGNHELTPEAAGRLSDLPQRNARAMKDPEARARQGAAMLSVREAIDDDKITDKGQIRALVGQDGLDAANAMRLEDYFDRHAKGGSTKVDAKLETSFFGTARRAILGPRAGLPNSALTQQENQALTDYMDWAEPRIKADTAQGKHPMSSQSPDYIMKDDPTFSQFAIKRAPAASNYLDAQKATAPAPTAKRTFSAASLDAFPKGVSGAAKGQAAIKAAVESHQLSREQAIVELRQRGWAK